MKRELEQALREGGEKVTQGKIRIDTTRALQRLRDFRFADPSHWVLEVLRAAVQSKAKHVTVETDSDDVIVEFDGEPFPPAVMDHLLERALEPGETKDDARARLLALGMAGALGVGAKVLHLHSGTKEVQLTPESVAVKDVDKRKGTRVHLRKAFGWRVVSGLFRGVPEADAVRHFARRFPAKLSVNGKDVPFLGKADSPFIASTLSEKGFDLDTWFNPDRPRPISVLHLDVSGVHVNSRFPKLPGLPLEATLLSSELRRNASGSDVVDDDERLVAALALLEKRSLTLLDEQLDALCAKPEWRAWFISRLLEEELEPQLAKRLSKARVLPDPAGEFISPHFVAEKFKKNGRVLIATRTWAKGSFPEGTVLLDPEHQHLAPLLPQGKRLDVEKQVLTKQRVAESRAQLDAREPVDAKLTERDWVVTGEVKGANLRGEVGVGPMTRGAFVQVLNHGRPFASGELVGLSPLRLRAVVDWQKFLPDTFFEEGGEERLLTLVRGPVEEAAIDAICAGLDRHDVRPLAFDLLQRFALRNARRSELPERLRATPLFTCLGGETVSLDTLDTWDRWSWVPEKRPHAFLSGEPVLVLDREELELLKRLGGKRLEDASHQLDFELAIRRRMAREPDRAEVTEPLVVKVPVKEGPIHGEVAIPRSGEASLLLTVHRDGLRLESTRLTARFHSSVAVIDSSELTPNQRWTAFVRNEAWQRVIRAVQQAERLLAVQLVKLPRAEWGDAGEGWFQAFLAKDFVTFRPDSFDEVQRAVASAKVFDAGERRVSLMDLNAEPRLLSHVGRLRPEVPPDLLVVFEPPAMLVAIHKALGRQFEDAGPELERASAHRRLVSLPELPFQLPTALPLEVSVSGAQWNALAGFRIDLAAEAKVEVRVRGRSWKSLTVPCSLPLTVVVEMPRLTLEPSRTLNPEDTRVLDEALLVASHAVVREALKVLAREPNGTTAIAARAALLLALGRSVDEAMVPVEAHAVREAKLFPCTDGTRRSFDALRAEPVLFVGSGSLSGVLPDGRPIVVADSPTLRVVLNRWKRRDDVEGALRLQVNALRERQFIAQVTEVVSVAESPFRRKVNHAGLTGEVVFSPDHGGKLQLLLERRPLVTLPDALPVPLAAAIDSPRLRPTPGFKGVEKDAALQEVIDRVTETGETLAEQLATEPVPAGWEAAFAQLAFTIAERRAWSWRTKKSKGKAKKKKQKNDVAEPGGLHPLMRKPLLRSHDGTLFSVFELIELHLEKNVVPVVSRGGAFLDDARAWWPRSAAEQSWASALGLTFTDVTAQLELAERQRALPRYATLDAPLQSPWRARLVGNGPEGEVALPPVPDGQLVVEVLHDRRLLERWSSPHPIGGVARVESKHVTPDRDFTAARRDVHFKGLLAATEAALERAAAERLRQLGASPPLDAWTIAVLRWRHGHAGAIGTQLGALELFTTLKGSRLTVDEVVALASSRGKVPVADLVLASTVGDAVVLVHDERTLAALSALGLSADVVTEELRRNVELQNALTQRRLTSLKWNGEALVRSSLSGALGGELAISLSGGTLMLAREGIPVQPLQHSWPDVVGVVEVPGLLVNSNWTKATPTHAQLGLIAAEVDALFVKLVANVGELSDTQRERVIASALSYLVSEGGGKIALDRLEGGCLAIARAPLFRTTEGVRVSLEQLASAVSAWGRVAVFEAGFGLPRREGQVVLVTSSFGALWLKGLETALGKSRVWKVEHRSEWDAVMREAEPPADSPLAAGLEVLRREVRLLRAGALGHLTPEDLEDVKLNRAGGEVALTYDAKRKLVLLDPDHPHVGKTLVELSSRPERLWVLLAALFGVVNRALKHVTDEHEAKLTLALAAHLASNPQLLQPRKEKPSSA